MRIRKEVLPWLIWLLIAGTLHLFGNNFGTFVILLSSAFIPVMFAAAAAAAAGRISAELELPDKSIKNRKITGRIFMKNGSRMMILRTVCRVVIENVMTGERSEQKLWLRTGSNEFELTSKYCGKVKLTLENFEATDIFGLFARKINVSAEKSVFILPLTFDVQVSLAESTNTAAESDEYSMIAPGWDSNETFAIREYIPGDAIKSIHWKISQKTDNLMVREFGLPVSNQTLLFFDALSLSPGDYAKIDAMTEVFISLSLSLAKNGIAHDIVWLNLELREPEYREIHDENDVDDAVQEFLSASILSLSTSTGFDSEIADVKYENYAHTAVIGISPDGECYLSNKTNIFAFSSQSYNEELSVLEL